MLRKNTIAIQTPFHCFNELEGYYPVSGMKNALKALTRCVKRQEGFALILGATGTGKTLLCSLLEDKFRDETEVVFLHNTNEFTPKALYQSILFELGRPYRRMDENEMRLSLLESLSATGQCPDGLLLIVDEAHYLPIETLNEIRLLSNGRTTRRNPINVVLSGNIQLEETLTHPKLEPLQQRTALRVCLDPWTKKETSAYINYRLKSFKDKLPVNSKAQVVAFSVEASALIQTATAGIPRLVNQLCDLVYIMAAEQNSDQANADLVQAAWSQMQQLPSPLEPSVGSSADASRGGESCIEFGSLDDDLQTNPFDAPGSVSGVLSSETETNSDAGNIGQTSDLTDDLTDEELEVVSNQDGRQDDMRQTGDTPSGLRVLEENGAAQRNSVDPSSETDILDYNKKPVLDKNSPLAQDIEFGPLSGDYSPEQMAERVTSRSLVNRFTEQATKPMEEIVERATDILRRLDKIEAYFTSYCTVDYVDSPLKPSDQLPDELPDPEWNTEVSVSGATEEFDADLDARLNRRLDAAENVNWETRSNKAEYPDPFAESFEDEEAVRVDEAHPVPKSPFAQHHAGVVRSVPEDQESQHNRKGVY